MSKKKRRKSVKHVCPINNTKRRGPHKIVQPKDCEDKLYVQIFDEFCGSGI